MTSTASQPTTNPAPNTTAASTAPSYASAAGATKKPSSAPLVVTGANPPSAVAGASAAPAQQNGRSSVSPAVPTVANGTSSLNGDAANHSRNGSVTFAANGYNSKAGGPAPSIQFGFEKTPQPTHAAPVTIPGSAPVISPTHSPAPIPQPSASGGKPGSTDNNLNLKIGSYTGDGDRMMAMRQQNPMPMGPFHTRRDSSVSQHSDVGHHVGPGPNRGGGYPSQGGRGRGGFNQGYNNNQMGFPPNNNFRGPHNPGRGGMGSQNYGRGGMPYPTHTHSPQPPRGSPALAHAMPGQGTPNMNSAMPVLSPQYGHAYPPPMSGGFVPQNYYNQQFDPSRAPFMTMPGYNPQVPMGFHPPGSPAPPYYGPGAQFAPPAPQPMSRNNSQMSERPASSTGTQGPMGASGPPKPQQPIMASSTPSNQFVRPKSKAITIKNTAGEEINLATLKAPASPVPSIQQSKTPPVVASTPTPPPKAGTPASHGRNESTSTANPSEIKAAFLEQVKKSKQVEATKTDEKPEAAPKSEVEEQKNPEEEPQSEQKAAPSTVSDEVENSAKAEVEKQPEPAPKPEPEPKVEAKAEPKAEPKIEAKAEPNVDAKVEAKAEPKVEPKVEEEKPAVTTKADEPPAETEDEYMERMIREMEEEDARREAEQAEITKKKKLEAEAAKKKADEERLISAAENDRKLREQEREMERLEEEREKARNRPEASEDSKSVSELLAGKISDLTASQKKETGASAISDKLGKLTINSTRDAAALSPGSAPSSAKSTGKDRRPAALNLAPLKTGSVEAPPPTAAMQALKSARFLTIKDEIKYPVGVSSPNPATNAAAAKKGGSFKYDSAFLMQFKGVFTEQPSVEFSQQVKALIGDSDGGRSASTRGSGQGPRTASKSGASAGGFGAFAQPASGSGKPLPPGTTSDQRFAMSQGQMQRPINAGAMAFGRGGGFPGPSPMTRTTSGLGLSNSRSGSRTQTRGGSKQGVNTQSEAKLAKTMPLTQGMDLKPIQVSSTGWKPMSLTRNAQQAAASDHMEPAMVQRKVKSNLNKMTPENFDKISEQILQIAAQSKDEQDGRTLRQVIQLTFEKATDEAHWAAMYAKFCKRMLENMSPEVKDVTILDKNGSVVSGGALFRKYLLNRCQEDFERGWNVDMPEPKEGESKEMAMMSEEYYKAMAIKRRGLGLVQFIGELYKLGMLTERIMHECVRKLLDFKNEPDEAEIESLSKLLRTIGANLDSTEKGHAFMNAYFERISGLVASPELPSRLKFMLMDIIDLRRAKWAQKEGLKGPKTLEEIRAEAEAAAAAKAAEASRSSTRNQPGGRSQFGRGDARNSYSNFQPPASTTVGMDDLRRLKGSASRTASGNVTLGPTSMFNSRSSSGRKLGPGGSLTRGAEDSAASSRTGTPPVQASANAFAALANMPGESENPASPPSTSASPAIHHAKPDTAA